jgi:hypothetical protein
MSTLRYTDRFTIHRAGTSLVLQLRLARTAAAVIAIRRPGARPRTLDWSISKA